MQTTILTVAEIDPLLERVRAAAGAHNASDRPADQL